MTAGNFTNLVRATNQLRFVTRQAPERVAYILQQWWEPFSERSTGEWRDVPVVVEEK